MTQQETALLISTLALLFTIFSFWWMNWRRGKLIIGKPNSFAASSQGENNLLLVQLPLIFYNSGALAHVVQNLRLTLKQDKRKSAILYFNNTLDSLASNDGREWARQFAVNARSAYSSVFVFQRRPGQFVFSTGKVTAILEGKINNSDKWQVLLSFELYTPETIIGNLNNNVLLVYDNDPEREYNN
jgi:hypothetical protein